MRIWLILVLIICRLVVEAQPVHTLPVFTLNEKANSKSNKPDTSKVLTISEKAIQLLGVSFRSYGPGSLQTLSYRGGGASQLLTTWEGMPINSSMNGQTDLSNYSGASLLPKIEESGTGFSGALSGQIDLSQPVQNSYIHLQYGTIGEYSASLNLVKNYRNGIYSQTNLGGSFNPNHFQFQNPWTSEFQNRTNASWQSATLIQTIGWKNKYLETEGKYWFQNTFRELPGSLTTGFQNDWQLDRSHKYLHQLTFTKSRSVIKTKVLVGYDQLLFNYGQQQTVLPSENKYIRSSFRIDYSLLPLVKLNVTGTGTSDWAFNKEYTTWKSRHIYSLNTGLIVKTNIGLGFQLANRADVNRVRWNPNLIIQYRIKAIDVSAGYEETTRYPTMNELYWSVGGNPNLQPENAEKLTAKLTYQTSRIAVQGQAFQYKVNNYLLWYPSDLGIWQAQSAGNVLQQGLELSALTKLSKKQTSFLPELSVNGSYTKAEAQQENGFLAPKRQVIFVPKYQYMVQSAWNLPLHWQVSLQWQWVGDRYIAFSGPITLAGYGLFNATLSKQIALFKRSFEIGVRAENLLNKVYYTLPNYPMPLRFVRLSITAQL